MPGMLERIRAREELRPVTAETTIHGQGRTVPAGFSFGSSLGYGLDALGRELAGQGIDRRVWTLASGAASGDAPTPEDPREHSWRVALMRNAERLASRPDTALRAGARQRISDFGRTNRLRHASH